jgi:hypothetical protein
MCDRMLDDSYNNLILCYIKKYFINRRSGLAQLVRFLVVELTHPDSNFRFDMSVVFMTNYSFSGGRRPCQ